MPSPRRQRLRSNLLRLYGRWDRPTGRRPNSHWLRTASATSSPTISAMKTKYFLVGHSFPAADFPTSCPDLPTRGAAHGPSGWRTHQVNILFGLKEIPSDGTCTLIVDLLDYAKTFLPLVRFRSIRRTPSSSSTLRDSASPTSGKPNQMEIVDTLSITGNLAKRRPAGSKSRSVPAYSRPAATVITVLEGSWILFDRVSLEGPAGTNVEQPQQLFIRNIEAAPYELADGKRRVQPLLVDLGMARRHPRSASNSTAKDTEPAHRNGPLPARSPDAAGEESQKERLPDSLRRP